MNDRESVLSRYRKMASFEDFDIKSIDHAGSDGDAPIHAAAFLGNLADIKIMLKDSIDINLSGDIGNTALHYAALKGHIDVVEFLLNRGASPSIKNDYGDTPQDFAKDNYPEIVYLLTR